MNESCIELTEPFDADGRGRRPQRGVGDAEAHFLAFHVAAGIGRGGDLVGAKPGEHRVAHALADVDGDEERDEDERHRGEQRPALARVADHLAERVAERRAGISRIDSTSRKFASGVGFSNGCAELTL